MRIRASIHLVAALCVLGSPAGAGQPAEPALCPAPEADLSAALARADMRGKAGEGRSVILPEIGLAVMRAGVDDDAYAAVSLWQPGEPAACPALSLWMRRGGEWLLRGPGSAPALAGRFPMPVAGDVRHWAVSGSSAYLDAEYVMADGSSVRRQVVCVADAVIVRDSSRRAGPHGLGQRWYPAAGAVVDWADYGAAVARWGGTSLFIAPAFGEYAARTGRLGARPLTTDEKTSLARYGVTGARVPEGAYYVERPDGTPEAVCVAATASELADVPGGGEPIVLILRLGEESVSAEAALVVGGRSSRTPRLRRFLPDYADYAAAAVAVELQSDDGQHLVVFSDSPDSLITFNARKVAFSGAVLLAVRDNSGRLSRMSWLGGTYAELDGRYLAASTDGPVDFLDARYDGSTLHVTAVGGGSGLALAAFEHEYIVVDGAESEPIFAGTERIEPYAQQSAEPGIVVDDPDAGCAACDGLRWRRRFGTPAEIGCYGLSYLRSTGPAEGDADERVVWRPDVPATGGYEVQVRWPAVAESVCAAAEYEIRFRPGGDWRLPERGGTILAVDDSRAADGLVRVTVDQRAPAGVWVSLGAYDFASGGAGYVALSDAGAGPSCVVLADAVKFIR